MITNGVIVPDNVHIKQVMVKRENTGEWYAIFGIETTTDRPENPTLDDIDREEMVGIDAGIRKYVYDTESTMVGSLHLDEEYERLKRAHWMLNRKERGPRTGRTNAVASPAFTRERSATTE